MQQITSGVTPKPLEVQGQMEKDGIAVGGLSSGDSQLLLSPKAIWVRRPLRMQLHLVSFLLISKT